MKTREASGISCALSLRDSTEWRGEIRLRMILLLRRTRSATILGLRPLFLAPQGLQNSAQGFNPGNPPPRAMRPEGGARSNVPNKTEAGSNGGGTSQFRTLTFARQ